MKKHGFWSSISASFLGLCCAGSPIVLAFLAGIGLGFLINDFILFPLLFISLGFMYVSLRYNKKMHLNTTPLYIAAISAIIILAGIFFRPVIWLGIAGLFTATIWDYALIRKCKECEAPNVKK